jgi:hypothetical protein
MQLQPPLAFQAADIHPIKVITSLAQYKKSKLPLTQEIFVVFFAHKNELG